MAEAGQLAEHRRRAVAAAAQPPAAPAKAPKPDPATQAWLERNSWFATDPDMRETALRIHHRVAANHAPGSDSYFQEIDRRMQGAYPGECGCAGEASPAEEAASGRAAGSGHAKGGTVAPMPQARSKPGGLPPARRSSVKLSGEQVELARLMGISPEAYARRQLQLIREGKIRA
jgi:hypothetical protein